MSKHSLRFSKTLRTAIYARDGFACVYCGDSMEVSPLSIDHLIPASLGGSNDPKNLVTACISCNSSRQILPVAQFVRKLGQKPGNVRRRILRRINKSL